MTHSFSDLPEQNYERIILQRYDVQRTIKEHRVSDFCIHKEVDVCLMETIREAFQDETNFPREKLSAFNTLLIIEYLEKTHAYYLQKLLPEIEQTLLQLIKTIGFSNYFPIQIFEKFIRYKQVLVAHIQTEEEQFFPYVEQLLTGSAAGSAYHVHQFYAAHHHNEDDLVMLKEIIEKNNTAGMDALPYKVFLRKLELLEKDLRIHAKVEDEVLLPMAELLEQKANPLTF